MEFNYNNILIEGKLDKSMTKCCHTKWKFKLHQQRTGLSWDCELKSVTFWFQVNQWVLRKYFEAFLDVL